MISVVVADGVVLQLVCAVLLVTLTHKPSILQDCLTHSPSHTCCPYGSSIYICTLYMEKIPILFYT